VQTSVYLPLMRVHGYMSNTEPWNYGQETQAAIADCLKERYRLLPYIYSNAAAIAFEGFTLMRPLVFDFASDPQALQQKYEYMFGPSLLVSPVTEPSMTTWKTYLPVNEGGWYDLRTNRHYDGGRSVETDAARIPVFVRAGSIVPLTSADKQYAADEADAPIVISVFPGADAAFTLYEDDGETQAYRQGQCSRITFTWDDARQRLTITKREGHFPKMQSRRTFIVQLPDGNKKEVEYKGKKMTCAF
jgi:alpha-D-xyloside xylohydrolase